MNEIASQAGIAVLIVHFIQWMKLSHNPLLTWISPYSRNITTVIVWICTIAAAIGIHWSFNGTLTSGGALQITFPPLDVMITAAQTLGIQWGAQKMYYVGVVRPKTPQVETLINKVQAVIQDIPKT